MVVEFHSLMFEQTVDIRMTSHMFKTATPFASIFLNTGSGGLWLVLKTTKEVDAVFAPSFLLVGFSGYMVAWNLIIGTVGGKHK